MNIKPVVPPVEADLEETLDALPEAAQDAVIEHVMHNRLGPPHPVVAANTLGEGSLHTGPRGMKGGGTRGGRAPGKDEEEK